MQFRAKQGQKVKGQGHNPTKIGQNGGGIHDYLVLTCDIFVLQTISVLILILVVGLNIFVFVFCSQ